MSRAYPVEADHIVVAILSVVLDGEAPRVTTRIGELATEGHSGEPEEDWGSLSGVTIQACLERRFITPDNTHRESWVRTFVYWLMSLVHSKYPNAPEPEGCTIRSKVLARLKVCCFCIRKKSLTTGIPPMFLL